MTRHPFDISARNLDRLRDFMIGVRRERLAIAALVGSLFDTNEEAIAALREVEARKVGIQTESRRQRKSLLVDLVSDVQDMAEESATILEKLSNAEAETKRSDV